MIQEERPGKQQLRIVGEYYRQHVPFEAASSPILRTALVECIKKNLKDGPKPNSCHVYTICRQKMTSHVLVDA